MKCRVVCKVLNYTKAVRNCMLQGMSSQSLQPPKKTMKCELLSTSLRDTLQPSYLTFDTQELSTASWQAQKCTPPVHKSPGILPLV